MTDEQGQQLTDEEMDDLVSADVNDPEAWGEAISVGPSKGPRRLKRQRQLELASKFYVLSVLHRLGVDATITFNPSRDVDLMIVDQSGRTLTVQIKTLTGSGEWRVADFEARPRHFLAFVWYPDAQNATAQPDVYITASERLKELLAHDPASVVSPGRLEAELSARNAWQQLAHPTAA